MTRTAHTMHDPSHSVFGFWIYILSDCLLFAALFASYAVLHASTFGGPSSTDLFSLPYVLTETIVLLTSSFTCGVALLFAYKNRPAESAALLVVTLGLGAIFIVLEMHEFSQLIREGNGWQRSGFLSAFFTLVGTHGLHVTLGALWMFVLIIQLLHRGLTAMTVRQLQMLTLFWHFLDVVWIFIFSFVYLIGSL